MKGICRTFVYASLLFPLAAHAAGAPHQRPPYTLTLGTPKLPLQAGKPLILRVKVRNAWERPIHVPVSEGGIWGGPGMVYQVHVLDERGRTALPRLPPPLPKGKKVIYAGSMPSMGLAPGQSKTDEVNISQVYNLSLPGKYKIWIAGFFYRGPGIPNGLIKSNTITVTVVK